MKKDYSKVLLGYRDYNDDEMYGKDFSTLDLVVDWISETCLREAEVTKEFFDFAEQEYGVNALIQRVKELYPTFPYEETDDSAEDVIRFGFSNRDKQMRASDFKEAKIPQG